MKFYRYLLITLHLLLSLAAAAQPVKVAASASQQRILIGEPFQLTLRVQMPEGRAVTWFATDTFPHFEIQQRSSIDTVRNGAGQQILVQNLQLTSWDSGRWNLPSFSLPGANKTKPIPVAVTFSPMDPAQPYHSVKDVQEVDRPRSSEWWWYLVGAALLLAFCLLLFPGKKKKETSRQVAPESAYREAMRQLDALEKRRGSMPAKEFYTELIQVFRSYLLYRMNYQSPAKTTSDLQQQLPEWGLGGSQGSRLIETLQLSDGVKFARFEASTEEQQASLRSVREAVEQMEKRQVK